MRRVQVKPAPRDTFKAAFVDGPREHEDYLLFGSGFTPHQALAVFFENVDTAILDGGFQCGNIISVEIIGGE